MQGDDCTRVKKASEVTLYDAILHFCIRDSGIFEYENKEL